MVRRFLFAFIALLMALATAAVWAPLTVLSAITPANGLREIHGIAYGENPRHCLDVVAPVEPSSGRPVVVFFYGGAWQEGDRAQYRFVARSLASRGWVTIVPDYRVHPEARFPDFLEDGAAAVRWARDHAAEYGGNPSRLFLMGHSAGAYNAAMLALDARWLRGVGLDPAHDVRGWIGLSGPYDFLPIVDPVVQIVFGPRDRWPATQPIAYVSANSPPALLLTGEADERVRPGNSVRLAAALRAVKVPVQLITFPEAGHARTLMALWPWPTGDVPVLEAVAAFIREWSPRRRQDRMPSLGD